ncbi:MAG: hypothetical protein GXP25_08575 [Planctomycetes bacterium]|nr:hypothetical protein [Planctomycetota bacterium]
MDCDRTRKQLHEYLDGALPESQDREMERHLDSCAACREELNLLRRLDVALRAEPWQEPPGNLATAVARRLGRRFTYTWRDIVVAAASVAIVLGLVWALEPFLGYGLTGATPAEGLPPMAEIFRIDVGETTLSFSDLRDSLLESGAATSGAITDMTAYGLGGPTVMILLILSALLAIGTNAVCYRQAHTKRLRETRL